MTNQNEITIKNLRETLGKMQLALDIIDESIVWTDATGQVAWYNNAFKSLVSHSSSELLGQKFENTLPLTQQYKKIESEYYPHHQAFANQKTYEAQYEYKDEKVTKVFKIFSYYVAYSGGEQYVINILNDITNQIQLDDAKEQEIILSTRLGNLATLGKIILDITHELQQPLSIIRHNMELCKTLPSDSQIQHGLDEIINSTIHQVDIANDIIKRLCSAVE